MYVSLRSSRLHGSPSFDQSLRKSGSNPVFFANVAFLRVSSTRRDHRSRRCCASPSRSRARREHILTSFPTIRLCCCLTSRFLCPLACESPPPPSSPVASGRGGCSKPYVPPRLFIMPILCFSLFHALYTVVTKDPRMAHYHVIHA